MDKLNVFSEKLGKVVKVSFRDDGFLVTPEGVPLAGNGFVFAWNNTSAKWMDHGWNNSKSRWQDYGWNNSKANWMDNGWNNSKANWSDYGWSNSKANWGDSGYGGSGCFITTACVENQGLSDDCFELQTLRKYRDVLVQEDDAFRSKVLEYYRKAPLIIQEIEKTGNSAAIYNNLYHDMIQPCVSLLNTGKTEEAKSLYLNCYEHLSECYLEN
jgi:hypothetical protein